MGLLNRIKMLWRAAVGSSYSWPAMDIVLPGERYLHLVGSIHMGDPRHGRRRRQSF